MEIKLLMLVTGDQVVSNVTKTENAYVLNKPHKLVLAREGLGSMPLCPFAKSEKYEIAASHVVWEAEPDDEIKNSYANATGSIVVAKPGLLTP